MQSWLDDYIQSEPTEAIDIFFRKAFGEVLSRTGFGFYDNEHAGNICMNLVDSARNFRWSLDFMRRYQEQIDLGLDMCRWWSGALSPISICAIGLWKAKTVYSSRLAYTFLLNNRAVDYQFWLNVGSEGWSRRLYQPLTHPYVLSLDWQAGRAWTDEDEVAMNRQMLSRLVLALTRRCRRAIYLGYSELSESGYDQRGLLLETIQGVLRRFAKGDDHV